MALKLPRIEIKASAKATLTRKDASGEADIGRHLRIDIPNAVEAYGFSLLNIDQAAATEFVIGSGAVTTAGGSSAVDADKDFEGRDIDGGGGLLLLIVSAPATNEGLVSVSHPFLSGSVAPGGCLVLVAPDGTVGGSDVNTPVQFLSATGTEGVDVSVWTT